MTTVGETFEDKSNTSQTTHFDTYFKRLAALSIDKTLNTRMRFIIEEVIFLRSNKWKARREQEGPLKISEIHQRIQLEDERSRSIVQGPAGAMKQGMNYQGPQGGRPQMQQQMQQQQFGYGKMSSSMGGGGGGGGGRTPQQMYTTGDYQGQQGGPGTLKP